MAEPTTPAVTTPSSTIPLNGTRHPNVDERVREHLDFLSRMATEEVVPARLADAAREVWSSVRHLTADRLPVPAATATDGGPIRYTWDQGEHHLEAEIPADGPVEWFYRNWRTNEVWASEVAGTAVPPVEYLGRIAAPPP